MRSIPPLPTAEAFAIQRYLRDFSQWVQDELRGKVPKDTAVGSVLLVSPAGKVYSVGVADDGTLETTYVSG